LQEARAAGKTRFIGYSGDNQEARWAVESGVFDTLQTSFSLVDQRARTNLFDEAEARGVGVIVKRPIANGAWDASRTPSSYGRPYYERARQMEALGVIEGAPSDPVETAFHFVMGHGPVDTAIVGTTNPRHLLSNIEMLDAGGSLGTPVVEELYRRFEQLDTDWRQLR
jgi:aryl-alcohol dehydrogenase-like predicted oxidoreductase